LINKQNSEAQKKGVEPTGNTPRQYMLDTTIIVLSSSTVKCPYWDYTGGVEIHSPGNLVGNVPSITIGHLDI